jgi:DNA polymerase-3 subunit alpha
MVVATTPILPRRQLAVSDSFVHLHAHSSYSLLDGLARIDDLLHAASEARMPALALTDHGTMFGAIEFYEKALQAGVKPIVGCEVYVTDRPLEDGPVREAGIYHLVLLAENEAGYRNLIHLTTEAHLRGYYRKPRVDRALLEKHSEGLICLSGCASSELATKILKQDRNGAEELAAWYRDVFPGRYYLELQDHHLDIQKTINEEVVRISALLDLPLVASNDVHYTYERQARTHEILLCIQTQTTLSDPKRMRFETEEFYLKSPEQMRALFGDYPAAITNTLEIAERCDLRLTFGRTQLPRFDAPGGRTSEEHLRALCESGLRKRYPEVTEEVRERLEYELRVIAETGFADYLLLGQDVIHFAREHAIAVGPGRGSVAGSIVAYCLLITSVDPIANGLSFERFLNPERVTMPDMDLDFADDRRDEVIRYVAEKYGRDRVAQIITFGTIGPRAGTRDVGRVLGMSYPDVDRVAKLVPLMCPTVGKAKEEVAELQQLYDSDPAMKRLLDTVEDLEGVARHASTHAAGVVIARDPLIQHVPLYKVPKSEVVSTQYAMTSIEKIGLLKMDFLALRTLTILERAREFVAATTGRELVIEEIPLEDPSIYKLLNAGETFGVFQIDGAGMRNSIKRVEPAEFRHVVALLALYRPGPMENIDEFASGKNGELEVTYDHPALAEVLEETYGVFVYQEQVMKLFSLLAGYSLGEADLVRRAMGKKKAEELAKHHQSFLDRAAERGTDRVVAQHLWDIVEPFSRYAFPKAHAAAYAVITCQTAYLKANHPAEYMAGFLSAERDSPDKVAGALAECRRMGIQVLAPDVNRSSLDFVLEDGCIRFGMSAIKHVGTAATQSVLAERKAHGPFATLEDFCRRIDWTAVQRRTLESLARSGACDSLGVERSRLFHSLDRLVAFGTQMQRARLAGQTSLFGGAQQEESVALQLTITDAATLEQRVEWEEELLGVAISRHPVMDAEAHFLAVAAVPVGQLSSEHHNSSIRVGGLIRNLYSFSTKAGQPMAKFQLTDLHTMLDVVAFSRSFERIQPVLRNGAIVVVDGRLDANDGRLQLVVEAVCPLDQAAGRSRPNGNGKTNSKHSAGSGHSAGTTRNQAEADPPVSEPVGTDMHRVSVVIDRTDDRESDLASVVQIYTIIQRFPGSDETEILIGRSGKLLSIPLPNRFVRYCQQLDAELRSIANVDINVGSVGATA